jgi:hydrogenase-4 component B
LGWGGALLHVLNLALFKSLLFMGAGTVLHETHTKNLEQLGGLFRKMPWTGLTFLIGAVAISGLPPLNGFVGEFMLYVGSFKGVLGASGPVLPMALLVTLACFARLFSIVFLGLPRSSQAQHAADPSWSMRIPLIALAALCVLFSPGIFVLLPVLQRVISTYSVMASPSGELAAVSGLLLGFLIAAVMFALIVAGLAIFRWRLLKGRDVRTTGTWDCGYALPAARMQYTGSSFIRPLAALFSFVLRSRRSGGLTRDYFPPEGTTFASMTPDVFTQRFFRPLADLIVNKTSGLRKLQHGNVQLYILYIAITLLVLLVWRLR